MTNVNFQAIAASIIAANAGNKAQAIQQVMATAASGGDQVFFQNVIAAIVAA